VRVQAAGDGETIGGVDGERDGSGEVDGVSGGDNDTDIEGATVGEAAGDSAGSDVDVASQAQRAMASAAVKRLVAAEPWPTGRVALSNREERNARDDRQCSGHADPGALAFPESPDSPGGYQDDGRLAQWGHYR
jgi:hypothetical protein